MNKPHRKHGWITHILDLLHPNNIDILDCLAEAEQQASLLPDSPQIQTAIEMIRFMDEVPAGFLIYRADEDEQIVYANTELLRMFQCDSIAEFRTLTGNSFRGLVHPNDLETVEQRIRAQITSRQYDLDCVEYRAHRKDGSLFWIEDYGHFIQDETVGGIFYVFLCDSTEKRNRLHGEQANLNQEHLRQLEAIESLSINYDTILYADLDKNQLRPYRLGPRSENIFDVTQQAQAFDVCFANYLNTWVHPEDHALFSQAVTPDHIRKELEKNANYYLNYRILSGDELQYVQMRIVNVGHDSPVSQIVLGFRSVDEEVRREMEHRQALAEALENANLANIARNTFLSNVSHDMRTPLNAIFGFTALAKRNVHDTDAVQSYLEHIETSSHQLLDLINKVLELSHSESGKAHIAEVECSLSKTIQEVYDFLAPQAEEKEIDFTINCSGIRHHDVYSDPERLNQLALYLVNNAVTYTQPGGRVSITVSEQEELPNQYAVFQLVVADTGIGISQEFLGQIFEPFSREKNTTLSGIHGIGLGLSIAKNIVEMMDGTIDIQSEVGKGSVFTITLHLRLCSKSLPETFQETSDSQTRPLTILLVEDNEINLEIETELLQEMGFLIEPATDGSIAVEKMSHSFPGEFDLILMDIQMPVMDGWSAAVAIRKLDNPALARIPIIALSANVFEDDIRKSLESGIDAHLPKPMDLNLLLTTIERIRKKRLSTH